MRSKRKRDESMQQAQSTISPNQRRRKTRIALLGIVAALALAGCRKQDMQAQPRYDPMLPSEFFANGASARPLVIGTVARGYARTDSELYYATDAGGHLIDHFPDHYPTENDPAFPTTGEPLREVLDRGQERYAIFCSMCHGLTGDGNGMVVQRGFVRPPSYHSDRLRQAPVGHIYDVISNGWGAMFSYGDRIAPADRWAIVAYIRTLQMSQGTPAAGAPADVVQQANASANNPPAEVNPTAPGAAPVAPVTPSAAPGAPPAQ
jgi:mono/diheme cytochrome c family protein